VSLWSFSSRFVDLLELSVDLWVCGVVKSICGFVDDSSTFVGLWSCQVD